MADRQYNVAIVGARGYVARVLMSLLIREPSFALVFAGSREYAGQPVSQHVEGRPGDLNYAQGSPEEVSAIEADVFVLGLPNGLAAPYVAAIAADHPNALIIDLSADYRHVPGWEYGIQDLRAHKLLGARRIANPGCYATAAILSLYPIRHLLCGVPSIFGVSGYSGAGTNRSEKNDPRRLTDNILPYGFEGHGHQGEISTTIGTPVRFVPHVAAFFSGLLATVTAPLKMGCTAEMVSNAYRTAYAGNETIRITRKPPEPQAAALTDRAIIGGMAIDPETNVLAVSCAIDNLYKGAASQSIANIKTALRLSA